MRRYLCHAFALWAVGVSATFAQSLDVSIAIRETGPTAMPAPFDNGGATGGIEWVNRDGQSLNLDGTWQLFTFTPATDTLTAFAGATANATLDGEWGVLEHLRLLNSDGITMPIRLWIDDVTNTSSTGSAVVDFDASELGTEVVFQEPSFSGSTTANLEEGSTSQVTDAMAFSGSQSLQLDLQFVDGDPTRWARVTTFNTANVPNPLVRINESAFDPTISFYIKAEVIPEPSTIMMVGLALVAGIATIGRRRFK